MPNQYQKDFEEFISKLTKEASEKSTSNESNDDDKTAPSFTEYLKKKGMINKNEKS